MRVTKQLMFNRAYRGLSKQRWRQCVNSDGKCVYSGPRRTHCAFGWIDTKIPSRYNEDTSITTLRTSEIGVAALLTDELYDFAIDMQTEHDSHDVPKDMRVAFRAIAKQHGLKIPKVSK